MKVEHTGDMILKIIWLCHTKGVIGGTFANIGCMRCNMGRQSLCIWYLLCYWCSFTGEHAIKSSRSVYYESSFQWYYFLKDCFRVFNFFKDTPSVWRLSSTNKYVDCFKLKMDWEDDLVIKALFLIHTKIGDLILHSTMA